MMIKKVMISLVAALSLAGFGSTIASANVNDLHYLGLATLKYEHKKQFQVGEYVKVTGKSVRVHNTKDFKDKGWLVPKGTYLPVLGIERYGKISRLHLTSNKYATANAKYVQFAGKHAPKDKIFE